MPKKQSGLEPITQVVKKGGRTAQSAKAALMAADSLMGMSIKDLAQKYGVGKNRVKGYISLAEKEGFFEELHEQILNELVPPAMAVYEAHLQQGNLDAARDVLYGFGILRRTPRDESMGDMSIEAYRIIRRANEGSGFRSDERTEISSESLEAERRQLPGDLHD